jgi:DNA uptake protein ComE-like DNA-binding protein
MMTMPHTGWTARRRSEPVAAAGDSGLSLIATLWIITVLFVLATEYLYVVHLEQRMSQNLVERIQYEYVAKSAIAAFTRAIAADETTYDAADEEWAQTQEGEMPDPQRSDSAFGYRLTASDENARININTADEATIRRLLELTSADAEQQAALPLAILQARQAAQFRTVGDVARAEGMTADILYGSTQQDPNDPDAAQRQPLADLITVYSADKNVTANSQSRTNIASADASALRQGIRGQGGAELLTQSEADAIVTYRQQTAFASVAHLLDVPAVTQSVLDGARDRLSTQDEQDRVNVNTADAQQLGQVNGFDQGTADDVVRHRQANGNYNSVDDIRNAKVFTRDELKAVVDQLTISGDSVLRGVVNLNTAPQEVLERLTGMDSGKAQAIVARRSQSGQQPTGAPSGPTTTGQAFTSIGDLLDVPGMDENAFKQVANFVTYRTQVFRVKAEGLAPDGKALARVEAVLDRSGQSIATRHWRSR